MNTEMFFVFLFFGIWVVWFSIDAWNNPKKFMKKIHEMRKKYYNSTYSFLSELGYNKSIDKYPNVELWLARLGFIFLYGVIIFAIYTSLR